MLKHLAALVLLAAGSCGAGAQSLNAGLTTTGLQIGAGWQVTNLVGLRATLGALPRLSTDFNVDGSDYSGNARIRSASALVDIHPFLGGFRVTLGVAANRILFEGSVRPSRSGTIRIGNTTVSFGPGDQVSSTAEFSRFTPYAGLGWSTSNSTGLGFYVDAGVMPGRFTASTTAESPRVLRRLRLLRRWSHEEFPEVFP